MTEFQIQDGSVICTRHTINPSVMAHEFSISFKENVKKFDLWLGHQNMIALLKEHHNFHSFLDVGAGEGCATKIMKFLGKDTVSIEPWETRPKYPNSDVFIPDFRENYMDIKFDRQFDVIWCSHVLEHIKNPNIFLSKIFQDLKEDGILALIVPYNDGDNIEYIVDGHINKYGIGVMIYTLITAGFNCSDISINLHGYEMVVFLKKKSTGLSTIGDTTRSFSDLIQFFPDTDQEKRYSGERLSIMIFKKSPLNWRW